MQLQLRRLHFRWQLQHRGGGVAPGASCPGQFGHDEAPPAGLCVRKTQSDVYRFRSLFEFVVQSVVVHQLRNKPTRIGRWILLPAIVKYEVLLVWRTPDVLLIRRTSAGDIH